MPPHILKCKPDEAFHWEVLHLQQLKRNQKGVLRKELGLGFRFSFCLCLDSTHTVALSLSMSISMIIKHELDLCKPSYKNQVGLRAIP